MLALGSVDLAPSEDAPRRARRFAAATASWLQDDDRREMLALVVDEAVTNAVRHAGTEITVTVRRVGDRVRVDVADGSDEQPVVDPAPTTDGGYGLHVIDQCTLEWGVEQRLGGKVLWFEV